MAAKLDIRKIASDSGVAVEAYDTYDTDEETLAAAHRFAQAPQGVDRLLPAEAGIGDAGAVGKLGGIVAARRELLRAGMEVTLDHRAEYAAAAGADLPGRHRGPGIRTVSRLSRE